MLEKIIGLTNSAYWWVLVFAFGCFAGWYVTSNHYQAAQAESELNAAIARADQGKKAYVRIIEAQNGLDAWRSTATDLAGQLDRMRDASRSMRTSASSCELERAAVTRCEALLGESVRLLREGAELCERNAAVHDALASTVK